MTNIKKINKENIHLLRQFIDNIGIASTTFRYFDTRDISIIDNHLVTLLLINENTPVAYGHLEPEGGTNWLGICVVPDAFRKGYGKLMMKSLIEEAGKLDIAEIFLTVDKDNFSAIKLYQAFEFELVDSKESFFKYKLTLKDN